MISHSVKETFLENSPLSFETQGGHWSVFSFYLFQSYFKQSFIKSYTKKSKYEGKYNYFLLHFMSFRGHYAKNMNSLNLRALQ